MDLSSERLRRISEEKQRLIDILLEVKRLRKLVAVAEAEARNRARHVRRKNIRLVADANVTASL